MILPERPVPDTRREDRRQAARRAEDALLHYATQALIGAAQDAVAESPSLALAAAVDQYEAALAAAHPEWAS